MRVSEMKFSSIEKTIRKIVNQETFEMRMKYQLI